VKSEECHNTTKFASSYKLISNNKQEQQNCPAMPSTTTTTTDKGNNKHQMNIEHKFYDAVYKGDMEMVQAMFKKYVIHIDEIYPLKRAFKAGHLAMLQDFI